MFMEISYIYIYCHYDDTNFLRDRYLSSAIVRRYYVTIRPSLIRMGLEPATNPINPSETTTRLKSKYSAPSTRRDSIRFT